MHREYLWSELCLLGSIGRGQFGMVHKATRSSDGNTVAVKVSFAPIEDEEGKVPEKYRDNMACYVREVEIMRDLLSHPNILCTLGYGKMVATTNQSAGRRVCGFHVLELLDGHDLRVLLLRKTGTLPFPRLISWSRQLASALQHIHAQKIVHRDIKSSNVMVSTDQMRVVVIDFGLAVRLDAAGLAPGGDDSQLVTDFEAEDRVGVFGYMPPEVYERRPYGMAVDIFAFGAILYQLLCWSKPLRCCLRLRQATRQVPWDSMGVGYVQLICKPVLAPDLWGESLASLVRDCMARQPEARPRAGAIIDALDVAACAHQAA